MKKLIALALFMLALPANSQTITQTADCTVAPGCRLVTDLIEKAVVGVDRCDVWNMSMKVASAKYYGGVILPIGELPIQVGCLVFLIIPDGVTMYLTTDWVRPDWQYSDNSNLLILTSKAGWVAPPILLLPPTNLRVSSCDGLLDLLLRDSGLLFDTLYT